jgi:hypothetical protein
MFLMVEEDATHVFMVGILDNVPENASVNQKRMREID